MSKKEKVLYAQHGYKWEVIIKYKIVIAHNDAENIIRCNEKMIDLNCYVLERITKRFKIINKYIYFNKLIGGIEK